MTDAGSSPTRTTASLGIIPSRSFISATPAATSARTSPAIRFPSISSAFNDPVTPKSELEYVAGHANVPRGYVSRSLVEKRGSMCEGYPHTPGNGAWPLCTPFFSFIPETAGRVTLTTSNQVGARRSHRLPLLISLLSLPNLPAGGCTSSHSRSDRTAPTPPALSARSASRLIIYGAVLSHDGRLSNGGSGNYNIFYCWRTHSPTFEVSH